MLWSYITAFIYSIVRKFQLEEKIKCNAYETVFQK